MMTRLVKAVCVIAGLLVPAAAPAFSQAVGYAYTPLDLKKCKHEPGTEPEDYGVWRCKGYRGLAVHVSAGDQRSHVSFGPRAADQLAARQTLAAFNSEGQTIEWRIETLRGGKKRPFAAILRWSTDVVQPNDSNVLGQVLVVTRLGPGGVCHVGYVDAKANANANDLARQIADQHARNFRCGRDRTIVLGEKGPGFSPPYAPELETGGK